MSYLPGFDYSHHNTIDFNVVRGASFAIGKVSEGTGFVDPLFSQRRDAQRAAAILWGGYHFADTNAADVEAAHFVSQVGSLQEGEFLVLDYENEAYPDPAGWCETFVNVVHDKTGLWPLVYAPRVLMARIAPRVSNCGLWLADPDDSPNASARYNGLVVSYRYVMQQYGQGALTGTSVVDLNAFFGTLDQLKAYGYHAPVELPEPEPTTMPVDQTTVVDTSVNVPVTIEPVVVTPTPPVSTPGTNIDGIIAPTKQPPVVPKPVVSTPLPKRAPLFIRFIKWLFS